jgi:hypothetical protein
MPHWAEDAGAIRCACFECGIEVTWSPADMVWIARELRIPRSSDGHIVRVARGVDSDAK